MCYTKSGAWQNSDFLRDKSEALFERHDEAPAEVVMGEKPRRGHGIEEAKEEGDGEVGEAQSGKPHPNAT